MVTPQEQEKERQAKLDLQTFQDYSSDNGVIKGKIGVENRNLTIYEWRCLDEGKGHTVNELKILRTFYDLITVSSIGPSVDEPSQAYWVHMQNKGLVDILEDDQGDIVSSHRPTKQELLTYNQYIKQLTAFVDCNYFCVTAYHNIL